MFSRRNEKIEMSKSEKSFIPKWFTFESWDYPMPEEGVKSELDLGDPPEEYLKWAKSEMGETPEVRAQKLVAFRNLILERGECVPHRTDDAFLLRFLRARYFTIERSHRLLVNYYKFKETNPEFYDNANLLDLVKASKIISVPPYREQTGRRMLLYRFGEWDPSFMSINEIFQATMVIMELAILEPRAQIVGGIAIFDLDGLTLQQAWHVTPAVARKMIQIIVTHFPLKIKAIHVVNQSWICDMAFNMFKPFLDEKMRERIFFHGTDWESLHKHVSSKHLPKRYGGVHEDYDYKEWLKYFIQTEQILSEMKSLGYTIDENIREQYTKLYGWD